MITKDILKQVLASNQKDVERYKVVSRTLPSDDFPCHVFMGVRRGESHSCCSLHTALPCCQRLVLTNDESGNMEDEYGTIEIMPVWKWLLI